MDVCNCDMFSIVDVYLDHLKFCVVFAPYGPWLIQIWEMCVVSPSLDNNIYLKSNIQCI